MPIVNTAALGGTGLVGVLETLITADMTQYEEVFQNAEKTLIEFEKKANTVGTSMQIFGLKLSAGITAPLTALAGFGIKFWSEQESALIRLKASLQNIGADVEKYLPKYDEFASTIQKLTIYGDDYVENIMAQALNMGIAAEKMENVTKAAIGLAEAYGMDLATAMVALTRASRGQFTMFQRMGVQLPKTGTDAEKFAKLLELGTSKFALAEARTKTISGALAQLKNAYGDLMEEVGKYLAQNTQLGERINQLTLGVQTLTKAFINLPKPMKDTLAVLATVSALIGPFIIGVGSMAKGVEALSKMFRLVISAKTVALFTSLLGGVGSVALGLVAATPLIVAIGASLGAVAFAISNIVGEGDTLGERFVDTKNKAVDMFGTIKTWAESAGKWALGQIRNVVDGIGKVVAYIFIEVRAVAQTIYSVITRFAENYYQIIFVMANNMIKAGKYIHDNWKTIWFNIREMITTVFKNIAENAQRLFSALKDAMINPWKGFKLPEMIGLTEGLKTMKLPPFELDKPQLVSVFGEVKSIWEDAMNDIMNLDSFSLSDKLIAGFEKMKSYLSGLLATNTEDLKNATKGAGAQSSFTNPTKFAGAAVRGSVEAYQGEIRKQGNTMNNIDKNTRKQADNGTAIKKQMADVISLLGTNDYEVVEV